MATTIHAIWLYLSVQLAMPVSMLIGSSAGGHAAIVGGGLLIGLAALAISSLMATTLFCFGRCDRLLAFMAVSDLPTVNARAEGDSLHDALTGLPVSVILQERLQGQRQGRAALLVLGIDGFRSVNEAFGHATGDALLREVAGRLRMAVRGEDLVVRLGSDEFAVLAYTEDSGQAVAIARRLLQRLQRPFLVEGDEIYITGSVGVAIERPGNENRRKLLTNASTALRSAKDSGRNRHCMFDVSMEANATEIELMIGDLRKAMRENELFLFYQPKLDLSTGGILGAEALLRWNHPVHGVISPDQFVPLAEKTGMIGEIGTWALNEACRQMRQWRDERVAVGNVAVNISVFQLTSPCFFDTVSDALESHGLDRGDLMLEITESSAMRNPELTLMVLRKLNSIGVDISLDDFGVGHSSLSRLKHLPVRELKIDRSFIQDIESDPEDMAIVSAVVSLAKAVDMKVIAEGVETAGQQALLAEIGCDGIQGFLIGRPGPPQDVAAIAADYDANRRRFEESFTL